MTTPKRNEAVAPCAWIVSNGGQCCEPWVVFEKSEVDAMPSACIADPVYSQQTIDALQGEVSRLRELLDSVLACRCELPQWLRAEVNNYLEPPTDGR